MRQILYALVLSMMNSLAPSQDPLTRHGDLAAAIAAVSPDLPTAALLVAVAYRESGLNTQARGDGGKSLGAFQAYLAPQSLLTDPEAQAQLALRMLQASARIDPAHPVAAYARGARHASREARRISDDRTALARSLL